MKARGSITLAVAAGVCSMVVVLYSACDLFTPQAAKPYFDRYEVRGRDNAPVISVWWNWANEADTHQLQRSAPAEGVGFIDVAWDSIDYFEDPGNGLPDGKLVWGNTYLYRVRGHNERGEGAWSDTYEVEVPPFMPPKHLTATLMSSGDGVRLQWDAIGVNDVTYAVHRSSFLEGGYDQIYQGQATLYEDKGLSRSQTYYYKVCARHFDYGLTEMCDPVAIDTSAISAPAMYDASKGDTGAIAVRWSPVVGADGYQLFRTATNPDSDTSYGPCFPDFTSPSSGGTISYDGMYLSYLDSSVTEGQTYYYKAKCRLGTDESALSASYVSGYAGTPASGGSWIDLGSPGSAIDGSVVALTSDGGNLYLFFADRGEASGRLKAMYHTGVDEAVWSQAGGYVSASSMDSSGPAALCKGTNLSVAYADTSGVLHAASYDAASGWMAAGSPSGVSTWDSTNQVEIVEWGSEPALATDGSTLYLVYQTDSLSLAGSLSYSDGDYWDDFGSSYWFDHTVGTFDNGLDLDSAGRPVAALQRGGGTTAPVVEIYRNDGGSWSAYGPTFDPGDGSLYAYLKGFLLTGNDTLYLACLTRDGSGTTVSCDIERRDGTSGWQGLSLSAGMSNVDQLLDLAMVENGDHSGVYAAVYYRDTSANCKIECWAHDGSVWSQVGPAVAAPSGVDSIDIALDSSDRPVLVYADGSTGVISARGFRQ